MTSIKQLYTRAASNRGVQLPIPLPNGKPSGFHFHVLGTDSDAFQAARVDRLREGPTILALPEAKRPEAIRRADVHLLSSVVTGWDFPDTFSRAAVEEVFLEAPHVFDHVNREIDDRALFFDEKSILSSDTPTESSN